MLHKFVFASVESFNQIQRVLHLKSAVAPSRERIKKRGNCACVYPLVCHCWSMSEYLRWPIKSK